MHSSTPIHHACGHPLRALSLTSMPTDPWSTAPAAADFAQSRALTASDTFLARVYRWMALGLALTGLTAWAIAGSPEAMRTIFSHQFLFFGLMIAEVGMVMAFTPVSRSASFPTAAMMFLAYAFLNGITLSVIVFSYTRESVASTFLVSAGAFGAMSVYGSVTKKSLASWGSFLMMGLVGVVIAGIVNIFLQSSALNFLLGCVGVVTFTGLTAYYTQMLRTSADPADGGAALRGALLLYLNFINLFLSLLRLMGKRRN